MRVLKGWAQADRDAFGRLYDGSGCACFISAPCGCCTHPGHPLNQECDAECWEEVFDLDEACEKAMERLLKAIDIDYECHRLDLSEAALQDSMRLAVRHFGLDQSSIDGVSRLEKFRLRALLFGNNKNF